jgi:cysteine desulfuration protein SufE
MTQPAISLDQIKEDFAVLDDWEDRYRYVIELGRELPPFEEALRTAGNKVRGCASQVWISSEPHRNGTVTFTGDSDALIVKGLIAIAFAMLSGKPAREIVAMNPAAVLDELGLREHLTPQRSNGFASMLARMKADAAGALATLSLTH